MRFDVRDIEDEERDLRERDDDAFSLSLFDAPSAGPMVEVLRFVGPFVTDHVLLAKGEAHLDSRAAFAVRALGAGRALVVANGVDHVVEEGETLDLDVDSARVVVRFAPAPWTFFGRRSARFAFVALLVAAMAAGAAAAPHARSLERTTPVSHVTAAASARSRRRFGSRRTSRTRTSAARRTRRIARARLRMRCVRAIRTGRRPRRRTAPTSSSSSDGHDGDGDPPLRPRRRALRRRGRFHCLDPPRRAPDLSRPLRHPHRRIRMASQEELPFAPIENPLPVTFADLPPTIPDVVATSSPFAQRVMLDALDDLDDDAREPLWSLRAALERAKPAPSSSTTRAKLVEVLRCHGERVEHVVLRSGEAHGRVAVKHGGRALVDGNELGDDGARFVDVDGSIVIVRWASRPQLSWTAALLAEEKMTRKLNAIASACGAGIVCLFGVIAWIAQYREDVVVSHVDDEWVDVAIPEPHFPDEPKKPKPLPDAKPVPDAKPAKSKPAPAKLAANAAPSKPATSSAMDQLAKLPSSTKPTWQDALDHVKADAPTHGDVKPSTWIARGPRDTGLIQGSALHTGVAKQNLAAAGGMQTGDVGAHEIRGKVRGEPKQLKLDGGALSPEDIRKVVDAHIGEIQVCYERQLTKQPGIAGRVVVEWSVRPDGSVSMSRAAEATLASPAAVQCMLDKVKSWKFPRPRGGSVTVRYPFVFASI